MRESGVMKKLQQEIKKVELACEASKRAGVEPSDMLQNYWWALRQYRSIRLNYEKRARTLQILKTEVKTYAKILGFEPPI